MQSTPPSTATSLPLPIAGAVMITAFAALFLRVESQADVLGLLTAGVIVVLLAARFGVIRQMGIAFAANETLMQRIAILGVLVLTALFHNSHFALLMIATVLLYLTACLGLNIQFGYAGMVNFAGMAFFGIGCYTAAVLNQHTPVPPVLAPLAGGAMAAAIGSALILPVLRTRGHYAALVTIAFGILFKTFLEVNDALGGPQGLKVKGMNVFGWAFNNNIEVGDLAISFYVNYVLFALILVMVAFSVTKRLERSWIGLNLDAIRLDETASAVFGINIARWKIIAFTLGNFFAGLAGAVFAMMLGYIGPNNFTFGDSLILVSIILLGGIGNPWGVALAAAIVLILPEKLQIIQEYRFLLYAAVVILILLVRPQGLLPRPMRVYPVVRKSDEHGSFLP